MTTPVPSHVPKPDLFSKIGPLPAWGWGVVIVGGYLIYSRLGHGPNIAQVVDNPTETDPNAYTDSGGFSYGGGGGGTSIGATYDPSSSGYNYQDVLSGGYTGSTTGTGFATNQQWAVSVISNMPKMGYSASTVTTAVTLYLSGQPLTAGMANIISVAIGNFGPPPLPLPVNNAPPVAPAPVAKARYTTVRGDTRKSVAAKFHITEAQLVALNPGKTNPWVIGTSLRVGL